MVASEPTPGQVNEDYAIVGQTWAAVLDGATAPPRLASGCIHDVPWLVRHLAGNLAHTLTVDPNMPLPDAVAAVITATCAAHEKTCDLTNPDSPSSTVTVLRLRNGHLDYLALADSPLLVDDGQVTVITDDRTAHLRDYSYAGVSAARNTPGGFYVASTRPDAAYHAVAGSIPVAAIRRAALLTDGASRLADYFKRLTWAELLTAIITDGPAGVIAATREIERAGGGRLDGRRRKLHDDASIILLTLRT